VSDPCSGAEGSDEGELIWTDDHCHLGHAGRGDKNGRDPAGIVADARAHGVHRMIDIGTDVADSAQAIARARRFDGVWATAGVHPHEAARGIEGLADLLTEPEVVAVGECGLDYHYDNSPREDQRAVFAAQVGLAHEYDLALVIHTRVAWDDTFAVLESEGVPERTVFHCFSGGAAEAERSLAIGGHLSFSGIVTFPSADDVRDAAAACPAERTLVETDAPFLAPVPHRGRPNSPALVPLVGAAVADAQGVSVAAVAEATVANAARVYRLD
jgi:TatD DNase family protein